uniref:Uncharacterized protein n=1 Tax=Cyprinus carpio TaxID=7962 RepID=A0A8C2FHT1_CYPCA
SHDPFNVVQTTTLTNKTFILLYFILPCKQGYDFKFIRRSRLFKECILKTLHMHICLNCTVIFTNGEIS